MMGITVDISFALLLKLFLSFFVSRFALLFLFLPLFLPLFILLFFFLPLFLSFLPLFLLALFLFLLFLEVSLLIFYPIDIIEQILLIFVIIDFSDVFIDIIVDPLFKLISFCLDGLKLDIVLGFNIFDGSLLLNGALLILFLFFKDFELFFDSVSLCNFDMKLVLNRLKILVKNVDLVF